MHVFCSMLRRGGLNYRQLCDMRCFSSVKLEVTENIEATVTHHNTAGTSFSFLPAPKAVVPPFDITRKLGTTFCKSIYHAVFERSFSVDSLLRGANDGVALLGTAINERNWGKVASITTADLAETIQVARDSISAEDAELLIFSKDDIVCSMLHSSIISGKNLFKLSETGNMAIYFTVISFVRLKSTVPQHISLSKAVGSYKNDILAVNITFARTLNPLGTWKATALNFFKP